MILNHFHTFAVPFVSNALGLLILLKRCLDVTFLQQLATRGLKIVYNMIHLVRIRPVVYPPQVLINSIFNIGYFCVSYRTI